MKTIGAYEYDEYNPIGQGGYSEVYKGRNRTKLHEVAAIRVVYHEGHACNVLTPKEIEILKALSTKRHDNIATLLHIEIQERNMYFVMEFCNGGSLRDYLKSKRRLDERTLNIFLQQIAAGLKVLHDMHFVHRWLLPENILLCFVGPRYPDPDNVTIKIADFGMGRIIAEIEMSRTFFGISQYMAPETVFGKPYDYKIDLWSVGVIAYECLVGSLPMNPLIALNDPKLPTTISAAFANLLKGLLEKDEKKRFDTKQFSNHRFFDIKYDDMKTIRASDYMKTVGTCDDFKTLGVCDDVKTVGASGDMKTVGAYEYDENEEIGRGGFGVVYKGRNKKKLQELVAIKEVLLKKPTREDLKINREDEIHKALSTKRHENIVNLFYCEKQKRHIYFVMEFCNGRCLREYLENKQTLDECTSVNFLKQIAAGLKVVHGNGIIHRDLKPDNILLCFSGPDYPSPDRITLKIADFGIGRFLQSDEKATTQAGSMRYMAPEVLNKRPGGYDYRADLWSVGVIAYECLVGSLPSSLIAIIGFETPANATKEFANLLRGLLENDEKKRFSLKHVLDYQFLGFTIGVTVCGPNDDATIIQVKENQSVDHLIDAIRDAYKITTEHVYLMHNGEILETGSGKSIRESGIRHCSNVFLSAEIRAGLVMDRPTSQIRVGQHICNK